MAGYRATFSFNFLPLLIHNITCETTWIITLVTKADTACFVNKLRLVDEVQKRAFDGHLKSSTLFWEQARTNSDETYQCVQLNFLIM